MRTLTRRIRDYLFHVTWLIGHVAQGRLWSIILVTILNGLGVAAGVGAFVIAITLARTLESGEPLTILGDWQVDVEGATDQLYISIGCIMLLGCLSGLFVYLAEWQIARIVIDFSNAARQHIFTIASDCRYRGWQAIFDEHPKIHLTTLAARGNRLMSFAVHSLLRIILPTIIVVVALYGLIVIDTMLTLLLIPLAAFYLIPLYHLNVTVAQQQKEYQALIPSLNKEIRSHIDHVLKHDSKHNSSFDDSQHISADHLFWKRKIADQRVQMINTIVFFFCVGGLFLFFQSNSTDESRNWAELVLYLIALRFCLSGLRQVTGRLIRVSRFLPEFRPYVQFVSASRRLAERKHDSGNAGRGLSDEIIIPGGQHRWNGQEKIRMKIGEPVCILIPAATDAAMQEATVVRLFAVAMPTDDSCIEGVRLYKTTVSKTIASSGPEILVSDHAESIHDVGEQHFQCIVINTLDNISEKSAGIVIMYQQQIIAVGDMEWLSNHRVEIEKWLQSHATPQRDDAKDVDDDFDDIE